MSLEYLIEFKWMAHVLGAIFLLALADKLFGISPAHLFRALVSEARDLAEAKVTLGGVNLIALVVLLIVGILIIVSSSGGVVERLIERILDESRAVEFRDASQYSTLLFVLAVVAVVSVWALSRSRK